MAARGKAVRSAVSSGRHEMTKGMRKTRSIGQDIERWWKVNEVQIPGTKDAFYRAFLDSLGLAPYYPFAFRICQVLMAKRLSLNRHSCHGTRFMLLFAHSYVIRLTAHTSCLRRI